MQHVQDVLDGIKSGIMVVENKGLANQDIVPNILLYNTELLAMIDELKLT